MLCPLCSYVGGFASGGNAGSAIRLAMLAVQRVAVLPVAGAGLYPVVLQVSSQLVAVLAGAVCLVVPLGGLAVLLVFVDQHTLAAALRVLLGDGRLCYLPPPMSALLRHCCGR